MGEKLGADVEALEQIGKQLRNASSNADTVQRSLDITAGQLRIYGRHGDEFTSYVKTKAAPALSRVAAELSELGKVAHRHVQEQRRVSQGPPSTAVKAAAIGMAGGAAVLAVAAQRGGAQKQQTGPSIGEKSAPTEAGAVGAQGGNIARDSERYVNELVKNENANIVFKNEEGTGADRMMTPRLRDGLDTLAAKVQQEWPGTKLRVTEAWDENNEHSAGSYHYEGRAADLTIDDEDPKKLARLYELARESGLDWVYYEDSRHVHVSVRAQQR
jgi:uncharacterized protein YcbK (DUF882 family)